MRKLAPCLVPLLFAACQGGPPMRTISGQLQSGAYPLDNAVVIAQSIDQRVFVKHVDALGRFSLDVPLGATYRLTLANSTRAGVYQALSRIQWPAAGGPSLWAKIGAGDPLMLGTVKPTSHGGGGGYESDDDDAQMCQAMKSDGDGDHHYGKQDDDGGDCEDDKAVECEGSGEGDSECYDDSHHDGGDHHSHDHDGCDQDYDDHEHDAEHEMGSKCHCLTQNPPPVATPDAGAPPVFTPPGATTPPATPSPSGGPCVVNADCATGLNCINSTCTLPLL